MANSVPFGNGYKPFVIDYETSRLVLGNIDVSTETGAPFRARAMRILHELPHFDWVGVYRLEGDTLILDEYVGAGTDHTRIAVGQGVCGSAIKEQANQIVSDVRQLSNYLSCSVETRSEIVVLIRKDGEIIGQIDVDGHQIGAFDASDEKLLIRVASLIADRW